MNIKDDQSFPDIQNNTLRKLTVGYDFHGESPSFQSYVANHSKNLQELTISNFKYFNDNIYQLAAIKKITIHGIFISAQEFVNIFKGTVCQIFIF